MDQLDELPLVVLEDISRIVLVQIRPEVRYDLTGQVVQQLGVVVIGDVVEVDQAADQVVLQPLLRRDASRGADPLLLIGPQVLDEQIAVD